MSGKPINDWLTTCTALLKLVGLAMAITTFGAVGFVACRAIWTAIVG